MQNLRCSAPFRPNFLPFFCLRLHQLKEQSRVPSVAGMGEVDPPPQCEKKPVTSLCTVYSVLPGDTRCAVVIFPACPRSTPTSGTASLTTSTRGHLPTATPGGQGISEAGTLPPGDRGREVQPASPCFSSLQLPGGLPTGNGVFEGF